jgi:hypothetical protein
MEAITRLNDSASTSPPEMAPENQSNFKAALNSVEGYLFPLKTWEHMIDDGRLPRLTLDRKILCELDHNILIIYDLHIIRRQGPSSVVSNSGQPTI